MTQDRRYISRNPVRISCHFTHGGVRHEAFIMNFSRSGALLSSKYLPQMGETIMLSLILPDSKKKNIEIQCGVVRGAWEVSDHDRLGKFGIRFSHTPLDLVVFISRLK
jgi:hypothetical protein